MRTLMMVVGLAALAAPAIANADWGARLGIETPIWWHVDQSGQSASYWIGDSFQPAVDALVEYYPIGNLGIGVEFREGVLATGTGYTRSGTSLGPNVTLDLGPVPIFLRGALPVHVEPGDATWNFRAAGGLKFGLPALALYIEATADFPLAGSSITPFKSGQQFGIGAGLWLKL